MLSGAAILLPLALVFGIVWISVTAKPLQGRPYRWATYIAGTCAIAALAMAINALENGHVARAAVMLFITANLGICTVGLSLRRKLLSLRREVVVIAFFIGYVLFTVSASVLGYLLGAF